MLKLLSNPLYTGVIRWGGETAQGMHEPIVSQETFDAAQQAMRARRDKSRSVRTCYVCNDRLNHQSCRQDYIRADVLEGSVLTEIGKLAERRAVVSELVREFTTERMAAVVRDFPSLDAAERRLWAECWIDGVEVKEVVVVLAPPLPVLGFPTTEPAPRREKPQGPELRIRMEYDLCAYYARGAPGDAPTWYSLLHSRACPLGDPPPQQRALIAGSVTLDETPGDVYSL